jgi:hypothetical protein
MLFKVWHARMLTDVQGRPTGIRGGFGAEPTIFPDHYEQVATVECDHLGQVFELTNHIHADWTTNARVYAQVSVARSTSVGDIVEKEDGSIWVVAPIGYACVSDGTLAQPFSIRAASGLVKP